MILEYSNFFQAQAAAVYLLKHGIPAHAFVASEIWRGTIARVHVPNHAEDQARQLLAGFKQADPELEPGWEQQATPDLSCVPRTCAPTCPACSAALPLETDLKACPGCGAPVDVVEQIAYQFGPDALSGCYPLAENPLSDKDVARFEVKCPACGYSLDGLAARGACPECGKVYDKARIILGDPP